MRHSLTLALTAVLVLTSCGMVRESRLNPFNWFGRSQQVQPIAADPAATAETRPLADQVLSMVIEQTPYGAIVRATALTATQGFHDAELVARPVDENGVLVYDFRLMPPPAQMPVGAPRTREVTVAAHLSTIKLDSIREIVVQGAQNARASRR